MSLLASYNLDTRLPRFSASVSLDGPDAVLDILAFETADDRAQPVTVSFVSHAAGLSAGTDLGWRQGEGLADSLVATAGERLVLVISREAVMRAVAAFRAQGAGDGDAAIEIAFTTIVQTPQGARASPRRVLRVTVLAAASQPEWRMEAGEIDLDAAASGAVPACRLAIAVPPDIVLEARRGLVVELGGARFDARHLVLSIAAPADPSVSLRRAPDAATGGCRYGLWLSDAAAVAGQTVHLAVGVDRDALLDFVDESAKSDREAALHLRLSARLSGWFAQDAAQPAPDGTAQVWRSPLEARSIAIRSRNEGEVALGLAGRELSCPPGPGTMRVTLEGGLQAEVDPDEDGAAVRCHEIAVSLRRWPLTRTAPVAVVVTSRIGETVVAEPPLSLALAMVRDGGAGRHGRVVVPMAALSRALSERVRASGLDSLRLPPEIEIALTAGDEPGAPFAVATLALVPRRQVHRLPICIDLGASAISVWSGPPRPAHAATEIRQLALGSWLARHVDGVGDEAQGQDGETAALIPSAIGLDSSNHLRSDHAPETLPDLGLVGAERDIVARRLKAFGRRYDVSVPAPPQRDFETGGRRLSTLKRALISGAVTLTLPETVNRLDPGSGRAVATQTVEVAPLFADVLDELVDLYVMRLGEDRLRLDDPAPPPVVPRILIGRPSGIGSEIAARYDAALSLFAQRLERLFPGSGTVRDLVVTVPEAVAATRYIAGLPATRDAVSDGGEALLVTLDIGGGGSDVALAWLKREGDRLGVVTLASFGLPIGGDQIDAALGEAVAILTDKAMAGQGAFWQPSFLEASLLRACGLQDAAALAAQHHLQQAVQSAKATLSATLLAKAERDQAPYAWYCEVRFEVVLAHVSAGGDPGGLFVGQGSAQGSAAPSLAPQDRALSDAGIELRLDLAADGSRRLILSLTRDAIETGAGEASARLKEIVAVMGGLLPRMARAAAPNPAIRPLTVIVPSGRAALWPPLFEAIAGEARDSRSAFPFPRPTAPAAMKKAVIAGAAMIGMEGGPPAAVVRRNPLGIAAMSVRMRDLGAGGLRTGFAAQRIHYLGYEMAEGDRLQLDYDAAAPSLGARVDLGRRFQFVRTVPGLDPQGRTLARLRPLLDGDDPMVLLDGEAVVDAHREGLDGFGVCAIDSRSLGAGEWTVTVSSADEGWEASWRIAHDSVTRL